MSLTGEGDAELAAVVSALRTLLLAGVPLEHRGVRGLRDRLWILAGLTLG